MKYLYYILIVIFIGLIGYNFYELDFKDLTLPVNYLGWVCILSGFCGLILTLIMLKVISVNDVNLKVDDKN
ncbi:MAG: hypothetical protein ACK5HU_05475 [Flavobacteriales bacterium]